MMVTMMWLSLKLPKDMKIVNKQSFYVYQIK